MVSALPNLLLASQSSRLDLLSGDVQPWLMAAGCALLLLAVIAAHASASLLAYSPTRLKKLLGPTRGPIALQLLRAHDLEFRVMARVIMLAAAGAGLWLTNISVEGPLGQIVFIVICLTVVLLIAVLPVAIAQRGAERVVVLTLPSLRPLRFVLLYPLIRPLIWGCRPLLRVLKIPESPPMEPDEIADEILHAVSDSTRDDTQSGEEKTWISNIVALKKRYVSEVMMPRTDIHALDADLPLSEAIELAVAKGHSRFPVYRETVDNIVGVFYAKDVLGRLARRQDTATIKVGEVTRDPLFAPESMLVGDLLRNFRSSKVQMAIVLDEYGGTAGLITIEDILEEIVGEIADEFDPDEELLVRSIRGNRILEVAGKTRVEEANATLNGARIPDGEDYDTVGGFVFAHLGQIPNSGDCFQTGGLEYRILDVDNHRVNKIRLTVLEPHPTDH